MWVYKKNHSGNSNAAYADLDSYLNLYINFKLKALDARSQNLQNDSSYIAEVKNYEMALLSQKRMSRRNAEYELIMAEYKDAVLMFTLSENRIWNRAQNDNEQLHKFYDDNITAYQSKEFREVKAQVISDYQKSLEEQWIKELRQKYKVTINTQELRKLAKL